MVLRLVWVFPTSYLLVRPGPDHRASRLRRTRCCWGWAGMRGVVTLAAAFVIPEDTRHREILLLAAFTVVAGTLFLQGLTLPWLARRLRVPSPDPTEDALARAALLSRRRRPGSTRWRPSSWTTSTGVGELIRQRVEQRNFAAWERLGTDVEQETPSEVYTRVRRTMIEAERARVLEVRSEGGVASDVRRPGAGDARRRGVDARRRDPVATRS